jgi:4-aminobutyrate aminotransferase-like enzyme/Ser/Thr protein kinase RdoA (MazF antagonist)
MNQLVIRDLVQKHFGLKPTTVQLLEGYQDRTFRLKCKTTDYILKVYTLKPLLASWLKDENRFLKHLEDAVNSDFPKPVATLQGDVMIQYENYLIRVLSFVPGTFLGETQQTKTLVESFGRFLGELTKWSSRLEPSGISSRESQWDLQHLLKNIPLLEDVSNARDRAVIGHFIHQFRLKVLPRRYSLRKAMIHNDTNDWNVLCKDGQVTGLIDFGDMCYSWLINELAVGLTYICMEKEDPLLAASQAITAYHNVFPILEEEADLLYNLIAGRLCISLCNSAHTSKAEPDKDYITISEAPARKLLHKWLSIHPLKARAAFRKAIDAPLEVADTTPDLLRARDKDLSRSLSLSYNRPIVMRQAALQYMYDGQGNTYLDAYNNIMLVGHAHPEVVRAATQTMGMLNTNTRYLYKELTTYTERLLGYFPPSLQKVFLVNSGSAATDLALRMARAHSRKKKVLALAQGYHGNTAAGMAVSHYKHREGQSYPQTLVGPFPKVGQFKKPEAIELSYEGLVRKHWGTVSAFIAEPIMGCGGQLPLPEGMLKHLYPLVREQGGLCISDEVQVGFGRLGHWMWGYEMHGVVPDMVILGKPMGNGHPIGAVVTTSEVAESFESEPEFFSSFGGNPVSCAIGTAVLRVLENEELPKHAAATGDHLLQGFESLMQRFECISDVRGSGLFLGVEFQDPTGRPDGTLAEKICNLLKECFILTGTDGPENNVLKVKPPLPFNDSNADRLLTELERILKNINGS